MSHERQLARPSRDIATLRHGTVWQRANAHPIKTEGGNVLAPPASRAGASAAVRGRDRSGVAADRLDRGFGHRIDRRACAVLSGDGGNHGDDVDLEIRQGEFVALLGRSGSGKSTFLRALAGLDHDVTGSGTLDVPDKLSVVFQDARLLPWKRVLDNVVLGLKGSHPLQRARQALEEVGLSGRLAAWPTELSGGEQQRAALARSLVREPSLLLADEPFGALDALTRIRMQDLLLGLVERHRPAVLLVTHDVEEAIHMADRVLVLDRGKFSVDLTVEMPEVPARRDERFAEIRAYLLAQLGCGARDAEQREGLPWRGRGIWPVGMNGFDRDPAP